MKVAIISDLHIGYERFYDDAYEQAREALLEASKVADIILLPGDVFDKRAPKPEVIAQALGIFRELGSMQWKAHRLFFHE
ncbi:MAG: metallophosphoesterase, partial [Candidatus Marsarchaeota archaeon]|nr:metallophosphoesterase [Candidatus Marsarchaeota archaeon]